MADLERSEQLRKESIDAMRPIVTEIEVGMEVQVVKMGVEVKMILCEVSSIGPRIEQLPQQLWRSPTLPQWGLPFLIKSDSLDFLDLAVGEKVGVRRP